MANLIFRFQKAMNIIKTIETESDRGCCDVILAAAEIGMSILTFENVEAVNRRDPLWRTDGSQNGPFQLPARVKLSQFFDCFVLKEMASLLAITF